MDSYINPPIMSLSEAIPDVNVPVDTYMNNMFMIEEALDKVGVTKPEPSNLPTFYDDMLSQLIDAIPLE